PAGGMLISQAAISAGLTSRPRLGPARAISGTKVTAVARMKEIKNLQVHILDLSFRAYTPGLHRIIVIHVPYGVLLSPLAACGLHVPFLIGGSTLEEHRFPFPCPGNAKTSQRQR